MADDLVTDEGVDEGSAASTVEDRSTGSDGVDGPDVHAPADGAAPPFELTEDDAEQAAPRTGQQLAEGEG